MSVIRRLSVHTHCNDLGGKIWNPAITWTKKYAVFVTVENEKGIAGVGECWCFDSTPDVLLAFLKTEIAPNVIGCTLEECQGIYQQLLAKATLTARHGLLASAWSGVDIALWDLRSHEAQLPLWRLLQQHTSHHPKSSGTVHLYAAGGLYGESKSTDDLVDEMTSMHADGFDMVKMKIGGLGITEDLARVNAVLSSLDSSCELIIDGVYSYSAKQALSVYNALPASRISAFQSPVKADDLVGMTTLRNAGVPVMALEAEYRHSIHKQLIETGAVKYLQSAAIACGGLSRLLELEEQIAQSKHAHMGLSLEVSSTAIALLAAMHFSAASATVMHVEYHYVHQVFFDKLKLEPVSNHRGRFQLPTSPGLGMTLPESETQLAFSVI